MSNSMEGRIRKADALLAQAEAEPQTEVIWGAPVARTAPILSTPGAVEVGLWELRDGAARDVEVDEVFIVLDGRALLTVNDGTPREIVRGDVVELTEGDATS